MKKIYQKINGLWMRFGEWGDSSVAGDITVSIIRIFFIVIVALILFYSLFTIGPFRDDETPVSNLSDVADVAEDNCSVFGINLHGTIMTYIPNHAEGDSFFNYDSVASDSVVWVIKQANEDKDIKAIVVEVDSGGGYPVAGEEISNAIKNSEKPIVGLIREVGASAAYLAISAADKIFASKNSDVGGIGVTMSYLSNVAKNQKDGYAYEQISIGKYKDSGDPDKVLTNDEKALFLRDAKIVFENFVAAVAQNRGLTIEKVKSFADGSTVLGEKAKSLGLIDEIGGINEVEKYLEEIIGEKPEICW